MKYASEDLRNEHEGILHGLTILERMAKRLENGKEVDRKDLSDMIDFLRLFADRCHHGKEEGYLFPEMVKNGITNEGGPIAQMLAEHAEGRKLVDAMASAISGEWGEARVDAARFALNAHAYCAHLRTHINKENNILFPLGDRRIPTETQAELLELFEHHEKTAMGAGTHEKLHGILDALDAKYR